MHKGLMGTECVRNYLEWTELSAA